MVYPLRQNYFPSTFRLDLELPQYLCCLQQLSVALSPIAQLAQPTQQE